MKTLPIIAMSLWLMAGAAPPLGADAVVTTRLGRTFDVGSLRITPLQVVDDYRCPKDTRCGLGITVEPLRLRVLVESPAGSHERVLTEGVPARIGGGELLLREALPLPDPIDGVAPGAYRFVLRYSEA